MTEFAVKYGERRSRRLVRCRDCNSADVRWAQVYDHRKGEVTWVLLDSETEEAP